MRRLVLALRMLLLALPAVAAAAVGAAGQQTDTVRVPAPGREAGDTAAVDTTEKPLVQWLEPDSIMSALLARDDYMKTRYQAETVVFDARGNTILLRGDAAVERGSSILVSDTIIYNDSTQIVYANGDTSVLRDPGRGEDDLVAARIIYDLQLKRGLVTDVRTSVQSGERWYVHAQSAAPQLADSALGQQSAFFGHDGSITSCDLAEPHYHFQASEIKVVTKNILVARPAVLYIGEVPVMWLPFIFQDMRSGRRSGILTPRFGLSDIVRNSATYRRQVENVGYYFAISDYTDLELSLDWRSGAAGDEADPGWMRYNGSWRYGWLDRFLRGSMRVSHLGLNSGASNTSVSWQHQQDFSLTSRLSANINYMTSTTVQRQTTFNAIEQLAAISSQVNYSQQFGPAQVSIGGTRKQYVGREPVDQTFPTLSVSTGPLNLAPWLVWTPGLNVSNSQSFNLDRAGGIEFRFFEGSGGLLDSTRVDRDQRNTSISFSTPLQIFGFQWSNSFQFSDVANDYPESFVVVDVQDSSKKDVRVFERTFRTSLDWQTSFSLPRLFQGNWNVVPSVSLQNVAPGSFWLRTERTGGEFIHQSKRPSYGLSISPTFFGLIPGIGSFSRFRHKIAPRISYSYAPAADVSDAFLSAQNQSRATYLGSLAQNRVQLHLSQDIEAKLRSPSDTAPDGGEKIKLVSLDFTPLSYDFERVREVRARAREAGRPTPGVLAGFTSDNFAYTVNTDLLPGFQLRVNYSLFQGSTLSDTARFDPYREGISASFSLNRKSNPFVVVSRIFGKAVPAEGPEETIAEGEDEQYVREVANMPMPGGTRGADRFVIPDAGKGWSANFTFSSARQRPPVGGSVIVFDPTVECAPLLDTNPGLYDLCVARKEAEAALDGPDSLFNTTPGAAFIRRPATRTLQSSFTFNPTAKWSAQWRTTYDFMEKAFASHSVSLQRDLHDWRAIFAFSQAPNGNFAFNFFISLKAEPDLKFDYNRRNYRRNR